MLQAKLDWLDAQKYDGIRVWYLHGRWKIDRNDSGYDSLELAIDAMIAERRGAIEDAARDAKRAFEDFERALATAPTTPGHTQ